MHQKTQKYLNTFFESRFIYQYDGEPYHEVEPYMEDPLKSSPEQIYGKELLDLRKENQETILAHSHLILDKPWAGEELLKIAKNHSEELIEKHFDQLLDSPFSYHLMLEFIKNEHFMVALRIVDFADRPWAPSAVEELVKHEKPENMLENIHPSLREETGEKAAIKLLMQHIKKDFEKAENAEQVNKKLSSLIEYKGRFGKEPGELLPYLTDFLKMAKETGMEVNMNLVTQEVNDVIHSYLEYQKKKNTHSPKYWFSGLDDLIEGVNNTEIDINQEALDLEINKMLREYVNRELKKGIHSYTLMYLERMLSQADKFAEIDKMTLSDHINEQLLKYLDDKLKQCKQFECSSIDYDLSKVAKNVTEAGLNIDTKTIGEKINKHTLLYLKGISRQTWKEKYVVHKMRQLCELSEKLDFKIATTPLDPYLKKMAHKGLNRAMKEESEKKGRGLAQLTHELRGIKILRKYGFELNMEAIVSEVKRIYPHVKQPTPAEPTDNSFVSDDKYREALRPINDFKEIVGELDIGKYLEVAEK